jgi:class 3 adenylate cyclase
VLHDLRGMHRDLEALAEALEHTGWAAELCDADWRLVWVSSQLRHLLKARDDGELGLGQPLVESRAAAAWQRVTAERARRNWLEPTLEVMLAERPAQRDAIGAAARRLHEIDIERLRPRELPVWTSVIDSLDVELSLGRIRYFGVRVRTADGTPTCTIYIYGSTLPAALLALVARGNRTQFERMARLERPGRRRAAVLFADLQASGTISRHLSSSAYFDLVCELWSAGDDLVIDHGGVVGKHAGDGVTAFFLVDDLGGASAAAAAAIRAARGLCTVAQSGAARLRDSGEQLHLNVGLHWGANVFMGQVVTGGRLEVTALGDEVNEAARIQHVARGGAVLASKALVEHLDEADAARLDVDADALRYTLLAEMPGADAKDARDAGRIPLAELGGER